MKRILLVQMALMAGLTSVVSAQQADFPDGWQIRFDQEGASMEEVQFVTMPPGMHITTGPAMIAYHPDSTATGDFQIESEVFLFDPGTRREAFGFFVGGEALDGPGQRYTYFLLRNGGEFLVKAREGDETTTIQGWTAHDAIASWVGGDDATAKNVLALDVKGGQVSFMVNGEQVWSGGQGEWSTDGTFGLRVNHGLNLHVTSLGTDCESCAGVP
ncbi:MAG: hypothetical protein ACR2QM_02130 [Longimicrobiales bacterium]